MTRARHRLLKDCERCFEIPGSFIHINKQKLINHARFIIYQGVPPVDFDSQVRLIIKAYQNKINYSSQQSNGKDKLIDQLNLLQSYLTGSWRRDYSQKALDVFKTFLEVFYGKMVNLPCEHQIQLIKFFVKDLNDRLSSAAYRLHLLCSNTSIAGTLESRLLGLRYQFVRKLAKDYCGTNNGSDEMLFWLDLNFKQIANDNGFATPAFAIDSDLIANQPKLEITDSMINNFLQSLQKLYSPEVVVSELHKHLDKHCPGELSVGDACERAVDYNLISPLVAARAVIIFDDSQALQMLIRRWTSESSRQQVSESLCELYELMYLAINSESYCGAEYLWGVLAQIESAIAKQINQVLGLPLRLDNLCIFIRSLQDKGCFDNNEHYMNPAKIDSLVLCLLDAQHSVSQGVFPDYNLDAILRLLNKAYELPLSLTDTIKRLITDDYHNIFSRSSLPDFDADVIQDLNQSTTKVFLFQKIQNACSGDYYQAQLFLVHEVLLPMMITTLACKQMSQDEAVQMTQLLNKLLHCGGGVNYRDAWGETFIDKWNQHKQQSSNYVMTMVDNCIKGEPLQRISSSDSVNDCQSGNASNGDTISETLSDTILTDADPRELVSKEFKEFKMLISQQRERFSLKDKQKILYEAIYNSKTTMAQLLFRTFGSELVETCFDDGSLPIHHIACMANNNLRKYLMNQYKVSLHSKDANDNTFLHYLLSGVMPMRGVVPIMIRECLQHQFSWWLDLNAVNNLTSRPNYT